VKRRKVEMLKYKDFYKHLLLESKKPYLMDEHGNPLKVYHGSRYKFNKFRRNQDIGTHFGTLDQAMDFVNNWKTNEGWIYTAHLRMRNVVEYPIDMFENSSEYKARRNMVNYAPPEWKDVALKAARAWANDPSYTPSAGRQVWLDHGVDGFKYINRFEGNKGDPKNIAYIVIDENDIEIIDITHIKRKEDKDVDIEYNDPTGMEVWFEPERKI
jgi:hypothetical protein